MWFLDTCEIWKVALIIDWWSSLFPATFTIDTVAAIALGALSPYFLNVFYSEERGFRRAAESTGDNMELIISDALRKQSPIEISLRNRKFYIGFATGHSATRHSEMALSLIPSYSGHRTEDNLHLVIDIDYSHTLDPLFEEDAELEHWSLDDCRIVIPVGEIVSVRQFDVAVYRAFQTDFDSVEN